jgi:hypothetical protein
MTSFLGRLIMAKIYFFSLTVFLCFLTSCGGDLANTQSATQRGEKHVMDPQEQSMVFVNRGSIQCESTGMTLTQTSSLLVDQGIDVIDSICGIKAGIDVIALCGKGDLKINIHLIHTQNVNKAVNLGFSPISKLTDGYVEIACPTEELYTAADPSR